MSPPPIFVGGTGRSGSTILGDLLDSHPAYAVVPIEMRFHTQPRGLIDVLAERVTLREFEAEMLGTFFRWESPEGTRGFHLVMEKDVVADALRLFSEQFADDRFSAARDLFFALVEPILDREGKQGWVEMTPRNIVVATTLREIFPEMKMVHVVRDGRDAAVSVANVQWGPDNPLDGLRWWNLWIRRAGATSGLLPSGFVHLVQFERLILIDREKTLHGLCDYLGIDTADVNEFFESEMIPHNAHLGRWAKDLDAEDASELDQSYRQMFDDLIADGIRCRPITPYWQDLYT